MANADWSAGSEITVGTKRYNVVEYQRIIHKALASWDGDPNTLKDPDGYSLVFSLDSIIASGGTIKNTFESTAIFAGGLIPTFPWCVYGEEKSANNYLISNGRLRGGALVLQLVKASHFAGLTAGDNALNRLRVQIPSDLKSVVVLSDGTQVELTEDLNGIDGIQGGYPHYEIYGGLTILANSEFLYGSTLYWHWKFPEFGRGRQYCYGEPDYLAEYTKTIQGVSEAVYQEMLKAAGFADFAELEALIAPYKGCKDVKETKGGCKTAYKNAMAAAGYDHKEINSLYDLGKLVEYHKSGGGGTGGGLSGTPIIMEGGISEGGFTSGPNFKTGRRTWIDIMP